MRGLSLRLKINLAIFVAFLAGAVAFGAILGVSLSGRQAAAHNRTRALLAILAAHRLEALTPLLDKGGNPDAAKDILDRLVRVEGVTEAALFGDTGTLLAVAGQGPVLPLRSSPEQLLPTGRVFTVSAGSGTMTATLVEPIVSGGRELGFLRLRYSLADLNALHRRLWLVFSLAVVGAYILLSTLLNLMLHRFVLRPVDALREALEGVGAGRLGHELPVASNDALGRMAAAFNAMSARLLETGRRLDESRAELDEQRQLLAQRVEERTGELARTNRRLVDEVAARREAEARQDRTLALYEAILESTAEAVVCVAAEPDYSVLAVNRRFLKLWGLPGDWLTMDAPDRLAAVMASLKEPETACEDFVALMRDGRNMDVASMALVDGRFIERRSGPILQGKVLLGRVFSYVDVTEAKRRQVQLEQARAAAEDASKAKGAFLAVMSHEIRTPLNAIMGLTEELLAGEASARQRDHLLTIQDSADHLLGVINDILDFSKIEAGKLILERIDFNVRELIEGVARVLGHEARRKKLAFSVTVQDDVPRVLRGDPGRLRQVLLNLLGNAVKFTAAGSVSLDVRADAGGDVADGRLGLAVRVRDTGIGMDAARLSELFQRFHQGPGFIARRFGGTGLGLAISKEIVERMGGRIEASSREGEGSTFFFTVRLLPGRAGSRPAPDALPGAGDSTREPLRILMVEDNELNAAVTRLHMERLGHSLTVASSAREAYDLLARERYEAVLMDIEMPEIDGITATKAIRSGGCPDAPVLDPGIPIIAITAHAVEDVRQQCLEAGMDGFVTKPVNYRVLQQALEASKRGGPATTPPAAAGPAGNADPGPVEPLFDPQGARRAMGISWPQYRQLAEVSFCEGQRCIVETGKAIDDGQFERAVIAAHTFKGAAATLGAFSCRQLAVALEQAVRRGDADTGRELQARIVFLWTQVRGAMDTWRCPDET